MGFVFSFRLDFLSSVALLSIPHPVRVVWVRDDEGEVCIPRRFSSNLFVFACERTVNNNLNWEKCLMLTAGKNSATFQV